MTTATEPTRDGHVDVTYHLGFVIDHQANRHKVNRDRATSLGRPRLPRQSFNGRPLIRRCQP